MDEKQRQTDSESEVIGYTATTTLRWVVVLFALAFTLLTLIFPAVFADFYSDLGNAPRAYACADRAVEKAIGDEQVNLRIKCVNLALSLTDDNPDYYNEVAKHTEKFLFSDECLNRAVLIDDYSVHSTSPLIHPSIYGYADYLRECNAKARAKQGKITVMVDKEYKTVAEALALSPSASVILQVCALLGETEEIGVSDTEICNYAKTYYNATVSGIEEEVTLSDLYKLYAYGKIEQRLTALFSGAENKLVTSVSYDGSSYTPDELYKKLIRSYSEQFNSK